MYRRYRLEEMPRQLAKIKRYTKLKKPICDYRALEHNNKYKKSKK